MSSTFKVGIGADISGLSQGLNQAEGQISSFQSKVEKLGDIGQKLASLGAGLTAGITLPLVGLGTAAVKSFSEIESLQKGLIAVMGSAAAANVEFEKLKEVAKLPGLGLEEAVKGSVSLQAAGFSADQARKSLLAFGNALATVGKGKNELNFVILALTQLQNKTSGYGQDLRQLTEQLPQLRGALKDAFGTSDSEAISNLGLTGSEVVQKLTTEFEKLPKVTGGIKNAFENLSDSTKIAFSKIGESIERNFNLSKIIDGIGNFISKAVDLFDSLSPTIQKSIFIFAGLAAAIGPVLLGIGGFMSFLPTITAGVTALGTAFTFLTGPIGLVVLGVGAIVTVFITQWSKIKPIILNTINYFIDLYNESIVFRTAIEGIALTFKNIYTVAINVLKGVWESIKTVGKGIVEVFAAIGKGIKGALTGDLDAVKSAYGDYFGAIKGIAVGFGSNIINTFKSIGKGIGENVFTAIDNISGANKRAKITDIGISMPNLAQQTESTANEEISKGLEKVGKTKKTKPIDIELTAITMPDSIKKDQEKSIEVERSLFKQREDLYYQHANTISQNAGPLVVDAFLGLGEKMKEISANISIAWTESLSQGLSSGVASMAEALGGAIASGGNIISALGKTLLSTIGDIAIQLGKSAISIGIGMIAIKKAFTNPFTAIAAGIALVALGAFIKGSVSRIPEGGGAGSMASSGSISTNTASSNPNYSTSVSPSNGFNGEVVFKINGYDLIGVISKNQERLTRLGN